MMGKERDRRNLIIGILIVIILLLIGSISYLFFIKPTIIGYITDKQAEGFEFAVFSVMQKASTCQPFPLTYNNQTINIIAIECLQNQGTSTAS